MQEKEIIKIISIAKQGIMLDRLSRKLKVVENDLKETLKPYVNSGELFVFSGLIIEKKAFDLCIKQLSDTLKEMQEHLKKQPALSIELVLDRANIVWKRKVTENILEYLVQKGLLNKVENHISHPDFKVVLKVRQRKLLDKVMDYLNNAGINVPNEREISKALMIPIQAVKDILRIGQESNEIIKVFEGIYYTQNQMNLFKKEVIKIANDKPFTAAQFRDRLETSRKYTIPIIEYLDTIHFTKREGESRIINHNI